MQRVRETTPRNHAHGALSRLPMVALLVAALLFLIFPVAAQAVTYSSQEIEFLRLINEYRAANGLSTLLVSDQLSDAATKHDLDMGKYSFFDHTTQRSDYYPVNASPWDRMAASGYSYNTYRGENIAAGYTTAAAVFIGWKNSPGHNANMLNSQFRVVGISMDAVGGSPYGTYWTTDFGGYVDATAHTLVAAAPTPDTTKPTVSFINPTTNAQLSGSAIVRVQASDAVGVTKVDVYVNGSLAVTDTSAPYDFNWNTTLSANGVYQLRAKAFDAAGNYGEATVAFTVYNQPGTVPDPAQTFTDVPPWHPYSLQISALAADGVVVGGGDGYFKPDDPVVRQQFAKMIVLALGLPVSEDDVSPFKDVQVDVLNLYPDNFVAVAAKTGLTLGVAPDRFAPWNKITRGQVITMVVRAADLPEPPAGYTPPFADFSATHYGNARKAAAAGLLDDIVGMGPAYDFWAPASRGEVCALLEALKER